MDVIDRMIGQRLFEVDKPLESAGWEVMTSLIIAVVVVALIVEIAMMLTFWVIGPILNKGGNQNG